VQTIASDKSASTASRLLATNVANAVRDTTTATQVLKANPTRTFAFGGYTGRGAEPAGIVHKGEYVFDKETTQQIGPEKLERFASIIKATQTGSTIAKESVKGFATGGYVGDAS